MTWITQAKDVLVPSTSMWVATPLKFIVDPKETRLFETLDSWEEIEGKDSTYSIHHWGTTTAELKKFPQIEEFFTVLTTTPDDEGQEVLTSVEAKNYPFYSVQYHPEKPPYDFQKPSIPHNRYAYEITEHEMFFFISEA